MPNAAKKRLRSEVSDNINPSPPKRSRLALWLATAELLTPHSVPLSPTGAAIWSGAVDLATVNERLLGHTQVLDSTSEVDSLEEWRRQYATDDESSPGAGSRAGWDPPDGNEERSTPATIYGSDNIDTANCAPQGRVFAKQHQETALSEPFEPGDDRPRHSYRKEQLAGAFRCERPQYSERGRKVEASLGRRAVASRASKRHDDAIVSKNSLQAEESTIRTRSGRVSRRPVRWAAR